MYHLRLKGDHYQMGVKRGNIFQKAHISFPLQLDNFQLEHGKQSEEILRKFFPEICEEVRGVSDAIGTDYLHFISWMSSLWEQNPKQNQRRHSFEKLSSLLPEM